MANIIKSLFKNKNITENNDFETDDGVLVKYKGNDKTAVIPDSVIKIGEQAFAHCFSLKEIFIPNSVTEIGEAFFDCYSLKEINVSSGNEYYSSDNGILFNKNKTKLVKYTKGNQNISYSVPESVREIGNFAFYECSALKKINIPKSVTEIGNFAFYECSSLKEITIPGNVTKIGYKAFAGCSDIEELIIEKGVRRIEVCAFANFEDNPNRCLKRLVIPGSAEFIGEGAFQCCSHIEELIIENGVRRIEKCAFLNDTYNPNRCLKKLVIPGSVETVGEYAFQCCSDIEELIIENGVRRIEEGAFVNGGENFNKSLKRLVIPGSVEIIGEDAFYGYLNIKELIIEKGVRRIEEGAFANFKDNFNKSLKRLVVPGSVETVGKGAFYGFLNIEELIIEKGVRRIEEGAFANLKNNFNKSLKRLVIPDSVETVGENAFFNCLSIKEIHAPKGLDLSGTGYPDGCKIIRY